MNNVPALTDLEPIIGNLINYLLGLGAIICFFMLLSGGFKYLTSGGDPKAIDGAQKTMTYAVGGLVVAALSYLILVIINKLTGANVLNFSIYVP